MLTIRRSDVPHYLHKSEFYLSLNDDDNDEISIPEGSFKFNDVAHDAHDLRCLLSTLRFWVAPQVPDGLIYYALTGPKDVWCLVAPEFTKELEYLNTLLALNSSSEDRYVSVAASGGRADFVLYLLYHGYEDTDNLAMNSALAGGHLECVEVLHSCGLTFNLHSCTIAAREGHLNCLVYAVEHGAVLVPYIAIDTASGGHVDCLQYIHARGCYWHHSALITSACLANSVSCLKYIHSTLPGDVALSYGDAEVEKEVVSLGHLDCIRYMHEAGVPWDEDVAKFAASADQLECLQYVTTHGCVIPDDLIYFATTIECLTYLHSIGCVFSEQFSPGLALFGIEVLRFAHEHGCPWDERAYLELLDAPLVDTECFVYAHEHSCSWSEAVARKASEKKCVVVLKYLREHGCPGC